MLLSTAVVERKLQIGKLSIWMEDGKAQLSGLPVNEAVGQVREWIEYAEAWIEAIQEQQEKELTSEEKRQLQLMVKKDPWKLKARGRSPEKIFEYYSKIVRSMRGQNFSEI